MGRRAGKLRHRIVITKRATTTNDLGQSIASFEPWKSIAAEVRTPTGRELERARQQVAEATHTILIRYLSGFDTSARITFQGQELFIGAIIDEDNRKEELVLICSEVK